MSDRKNVDRSSGGELVAWQQVALPSWCRVDFSSSATTPSIAEASDDSSVLTLPGGDPLRIYSPPAACWPDREVPYLLLECEGRGNKHYLITSINGKMAFAQIARDKFYQLVRGDLWAAGSLPLQGYADRGWKIRRREGVILLVNPDVTRVQVLAVSAGMPSGGIAYQNGYSSDINLLHSGVHLRNGGEVSDSLYRDGELLARVWMCDYVYVPDGEEEDYCVAGDPSAQRGHVLVERLDTIELVLQGSVGLRNADRLFSEGWVHPPLPVREASPAEMVLGSASSDSGADADEPEE